jgi:hypothetical protein
MKNKDKNKNKNNKKINDLTSFISAEDLKYDPYGSYTGTTAETYYGDEYDDPVQDADDL